MARWRLNARPHDQLGELAKSLADHQHYGMTAQLKVEIKCRLVEEFNLHTVVRMPQSAFEPYTSITTNRMEQDNRAA